MSGCPMSTVFGRAVPGGDRLAAPTNSMWWLATSSSPSFGVLTSKWEACDLGNMNPGHLWGQGASQGGV